MKTSSRSILTVLTLFFLAAIEPTAQAVNPPPDGGYAGFNTAEGTNALKNLSTGVGNAAVGWFSLFSNTDGSFNTALGAGTLLFNIGNQSTGEGIKNSAIGTAALLFNATGTDNTAVGAAALLNNTAGSENTAIGDGALLNNTIGALNTAVGDSALLHNTNGAYNTAVGNQALFNNTSSQENTAVGYRALGNNQPGNFNTAVGGNALLNTTGGENTAIGVDALTADTTGNGNTAVGGGALPVNTTGTGNTAVGASALGSDTTGSGNTTLGLGAGGNITTASNVICIGAAGANVNDSCYIGNIFSETSASGIPVLVNNFNKLGTTTSSKRFKEDIKPMGKSSEALLALQPVTFRYKKEIDPTGTPQLGLVAEDVEKVNPNLVVRDQEGKPYSVRYDQVNAMLLNEFLKSHKTMQEQGATITELKREIASLATTVKEQAAQIQKVSAHLEMTKPAPQIAGNQR